MARRLDPLARELIESLRDQITTLKMHNARLEADLARQRTAIMDLARLHREDLQPPATSASHLTKEEEDDFCAELANSKFS